MSSDQRFSLLKGASGMISIFWILSKFYPHTEKGFNIPYFIFKDRVPPRKKWPITMNSMDMCYLSFGGENYPVDSVFICMYIYLPSAPKNTSIPLSVKNFLIVTHTLQIYPLFSTEIFPTRSLQVMKKFFQQKVIPNHIVYIFK